MRARSGINFDLGGSGGGGGAGTVTSIDIAVPSFLTSSGGPVTTSGVITLSYSGTALPIANGGTGQTTAANAINALLPTQTGHSGEFLTTNGTVASWAASSGGVSSLSAIGAVPNANAATITGSVLNLQPADASFGGVVTTTTQTLAGAKTFTSTVTVNTTAGTSTGVAVTVTGNTNGIIVTNTTMGTFNNCLLRLVGTVTSPVTNNFYKGLVLNLDTGNSTNIRYVYGYDITTNGGGTGATNTVGYHSDMTVAQQGALSTYNGTGLFGSYQTVRGNQTTTGNGNVGHASYVTGSNNNIGFFSVVDAAGGTTPVNCGYISNVTSSGATVTAGAFFRISTATSQASFDTLPTVSAGLVVSNGNTTSNIVNFLDNTTSVFSIADGGAVTIGQGTSTQHTLNTLLATNAAGILTLTNAPAGIAGDPTGYEQITINGSTRLRPFW